MLPTFLLNSPLYEWLSVNLKIDLFQENNYCMKNFITGLSIATAIGVAVLFYLHFYGFIFHGLYFYQVLKGSKFFISIIHNVPNYTL